MTPVDTLNLKDADLQQLFRLWLIDGATLEILRKVRPVLKNALDGQEQDFYVSFRDDPLVARSFPDDDTRRREAATLARFWQTIIVGDLNEAKISHAAALGRQHFNLGLGSGHFLLASQGVMRRLVDGLSGVEAPDWARAIDAVTRLVLLADDIALTAYFGGVADRLSALEVTRRTEELQQQMRVLEEMAHVDGLTKLFNRRHFDQALEAELSRSTRQRSPLCLLLADLDNFKQVNDAHGHRTGDDQLCHVAKVLHSAARRSDVLARYGGEEFAFILPNTTIDRAKIAAERLRSAIERQPMPWENGNTLGATVSVGIAIFDHVQSPSELVHAADQALYRAKALGRNQVST